LKRLHEGPPAYFLAQAAVIPIVGYLSDRVGIKLIFLIALILFTTGSVLCAIAPTIEALVAFRVFQGIGGGALLPIAFAIIFLIFPPNERGMASAFLGIAVMMAPAFGPAVGGYLSTSFAWNAIFLINVPIGVVAFILALLVLPGSKADSEHLDILNQQKTSYLEMSRGLAESGVEKWTFDTNNLTITYCDKAGHEMFAEALK